VKRLFCPSDPFSLIDVSSCFAAYVIFLIPFFGKKRKGKALLQVSGRINCYAFRDKPDGIHRENRD